MSTTIHTQAPAQATAPALRGSLPKTTDAPGNPFGDTLAQTIDSAARQAEPAARTGSTAQPTGSQYLHAKTADHDTRHSGKPDTATFMRATGADFSTASSLLYGVVGSNTDYRDWNAIMASGDPVQAARQAYGESRRALELLLGRYPAAEIEVATTYPTVQAMSPAGVPAALLERRPDVLAAEQAVVAAFRNQESAELALLPSFGLSLGGGRFSDTVLSLLRLNPWLATAAVGVSVPVYEGGALQAQVVIATEQQARLVARYGAVALAAFWEVENALAAEPFLAAQLPLEQKSLASRQDAVRIATVQYTAGRRDLLWVSQLQAGALQTEAGVIRLGSTLLVNRVRLAQALGSSYDGTPAAAIGGPLAAASPSAGAGS